MSVELTYIFQGLASYKAGMTGEPFTSGGVVFWNLDVCRKLLEKKNTIINLLLRSQYTDEVFINNLLKFWVGKGGRFYIADKLFNSLPHCWLQTKCYYNFLKLLNAGENNRNEYIEKVVDFWPVEHLEKAISGEEPVQNKEKVRSFIDKVLEVPSSDNMDISDYKDCINVFDEEQDKKIAGNILQFFINTKTNKDRFDINADIVRGTCQELYDRLQYLDETPVVLHWNQKEKPWKKVAKILAGRNIEISPNNVFDVLNSFVINKTLNPADTLWISNMLSWLRAGEKDNNSQSQKAKQGMICDWFNSVKESL